MPPIDLLKKAKIIAHRGAWGNGILENTRPAFEACLNQGIWGVEMDLRWTQDHRALIHHDPSTLRVFQKNLEIKESRLETLKKETPEILTLAEVIRTMGGKIHLMIELKTLLSPPQVANLKRELKDLAPGQDYHLMSLNPQYLFNLDFLPTKTFVSIATTHIRPILQETLKRQWGGFTGHYLLLNSQIQKICTDKNIATGTGFPDSPNLLFREINREMDWIFTDQALHLSSLIQSHL